MLDTEVFDQDRYFDVIVEYAKESAGEILIQITVHNRGLESAELHLLPTLLFRNQWFWNKGTTGPCCNMFNRDSQPQFRNCLRKRFRRAKMKQTATKQLPIESSGAFQGEPMPGSAMMDALPLWGLFVFTVVVVILSIESGYQIGIYRHRRAAGEKEAAVGAIVGATLALLGFILAFTFGLAASRFNERREIVVEEANAIGTTYLRAGLIPDKSGTKIRRLLGEYVDARLEVFQTKDIEKVLRRSEELHQQLWKEAEAVGRVYPNSIVVGLFIQSLNETIDIHAKRVLVGLQNRLPGILWVILYLITILTMAGVGYQEGLANSKRSLAIVVLVITFSAILILVADLDRPQEGFLKVSQKAMTDLQKMIGEMP